MNIRSVIIIFIIKININRAEIHVEKDLIAPHNFDSEVLLV